MKTLTSYVRRPLPAFFVVLFSIFTAFAQTTDLRPADAEIPAAGGTNSAPQTTYINNQTGLQKSANFYIDGSGTASIFSATTQFSIGSKRVLSISGAGNLFIGYNAGSKTPGQNNSFAGSYAGYINTGSWNSFFGYNAGGGNTSGKYNSFFGAEAGTANAESQNNSFFGYRAGFYNMTGKYNSFVGSETGQNNMGGSYNTIIGANADLTKDKLFFATAIGANAHVSTNDTIVLGKIQGTYDNVAHPADTVLVQGLLQLNTLGAAGGLSLCRNTSNQISNCSSSLRYKKNIAPFSSGLNLLRRLQPIRFEWKEGGRKDIGFGAEDVAAVEPLLVTYNDKGEVEGVKYEKLTTVLVNAVKEQQAQIEAQQQQLKQQQGQLKEQQAVIEGLKKLLCGQNPNAEVCKQ